jgi:hypothetical protein
MNRWSRLLLRPLSIEAQLQDFPAGSPGDLQSGRSPGLHAPSSEKTSKKLTFFLSRDRQITSASVIRVDRQLRPMQCTGKRYRIAIAAKIDAQPQISYM